MAIVLETGVVQVEVDSSKVPAQLATTKSLFDNFALQTSNSLVKAFTASHKTISSLMQDLADKIYQAFRNSLATIPAMLRSLEGELTKLQGFMSSMSLSVGAEQAADQYQFLKRVANELGVSLSSLVENYGRLASAMTSSGAPLSSVQNLFEGLARASRSYHLSAQDTHWAMYAFTQIASKAKLSMEELNRQFGEKVPGALAIFAESLRGPLEKELDKTGASIQELKSKLIDLVKAGKIDPIQFSIAVGPDLMSTFAASSEIASKSVDSAINRLENLWTDFAQTVLQTGAAEKIAGMFDAITSKLNDTSVLNMFADLLGETASSFTEKIKAITAEDIRIGFEAIRDFLKSITELFSQLIKAAPELLRSFREIAVLAITISGARTGATLGSAFGPQAGVVGAGAGALVAGGASTYMMYPGAKEPIKNVIGGLTSSFGMPGIPGLINKALQIDLPKTGDQRSRLSSGLINGGNTVATTTYEYGGRSKLPAYAYRAEMDRQTALDNLLLGGGDSKGDKKAQAEINQLRKFISGLGAGVKGEAEGYSKSTIQELEKLDQAKKKLNLSEAEYVKYREYILATDPQVIKGQKELQKAYEDAIKPLNDQLEQLQEQNKFYGMADSQKQLLIISEREEALQVAKNTLLKEDNAAKTLNLIKILTDEVAVRKQLAVEYDKSAANKLKDQFKSPQQTYKDKTNELDRLAADGHFKDNPEAYFAGLDAAQKELDKLTGKTKDTFTDMSQFAKQAANNMQDAMADFFFNVMEGKMDNLAADFGKMLNKMVANAMAAQLGRALFGDMQNSGKVGGLLGAGVDYLKKSFSGSSGNPDPNFDVQAYADSFVTSAKGNVLGGRGISRLSNSFVSSPTFFSMDRIAAFASGGMVGVAGEAGTEAIMPVKRDSSGNLGVSASGMIPNVNITIHNTESSQVQVSANPKMNNGNIDIDVIVQRVLAKDMKKNGPITQGLANTFALSRSV